MIVPGLPHVVAHSRRCAARTLYEECLDGRRRTLGAEHPHTISAIAGLGQTLVDCGDW